MWVVVSEFLFCRLCVAPPCEIGFRSTTEGLEVPQGDKVFVNVSLNYVQSEERPLKSLTKRKIRRYTVDLSRLPVGTR
jgi:hypothetical protein